MQVILSLIVGTLLVTGQSLWKLSTDASGIPTIKNLGTIEVLRTLVSFILHPLFITGCIVYLIATVLYVYVISKYNYGVTYAMIVGFSTVIAILISSAIFKEKIYPVNLIGVTLIILGIALVVKK